MEQRLEDLWPNLLSQNTENESQIDDSLLNQQEDFNLAEIVNDQLVKDKIQAFKNLYWTRVLSPDNFDIDEEKKWQMSFDLANELQQLNDINENDLPEWTPLWDPNFFTEDHPVLKTKDFEYSEETLR